MSQREWGGRDGRWGRKQTQLARDIAQVDTQVLAVASRDYHGVQEALQLCGLGRQAGLKQQPAAGAAACSTALPPLHAWQLRQPRQPRAAPLAWRPSHRQDMSASTWAGAQRCSFAQGSAIGRGALLQPEHTSKMPLAATAVPAAVQYPNNIITKSTDASFSTALREQRLRGWLPASAQTRCHPAMLSPTPCI